MNRDVSDPSLSAGADPSESGDKAAGRSPHRPSSSEPDPEQEQNVIGLLRDFALPTSLGRDGRFRALKILGRGGCGIVVLAHDEELHLNVAVKFPKPGLLASHDARQQFLAEARAAARLDHRGIVRVRDSGAEGSICYIVYDYCDSGSLAGWLADRGGPVSPELSARLVAWLADAVQHAHDAKILHCDLKPGNILRQSPRQSGGGLCDAFPYLPLVGDFGLAKLIDRPEDEIKGGTASYTSPEQARGDPHVNFPSDVYSLGAILYELLTKRPPFQGETGREILPQVLSDSPPTPPRELRPDIPRDLEAICLKCLNKKPGDRYPTAADLAGDLRRFLEIRPVAVRQVPPWAHLWYAARRHPIATPMAGTFILLMATGLATHLQNRDEARINGEIQELNSTTDLAKLPSVVFRLRDDLPRSEPNLVRMFESRDPDERFKAALVLAPTRPDCRKYLFEQLLGAEPTKLRCICAVLEQTPGMLDLPSPDRPLVDLLEAHVATEPAASAPESRREALARERANAASALIRLGRPEAGWRLLDRRPDLLVRSYLIHRLGPAGLPPGALADRLEIESSSPIRSALIQALGEVPDPAWAGFDRRPLIDTLLKLYQDDPDPGVHGSAKWLLLRWERQQDLSLHDLGARRREIDDKATVPPDQACRTWRVARPLGLTFLALRLTDRGTARLVEVGDTEVTVGQFLRSPPFVTHEYNRNVSPGDDYPMNAVTGNDAMAFCNWLSGQEKISPEQFAYRLNRDGHYEPFADAADRSGYRLLTDEEAKAASRAGSTTNRFFGDSDLLLEHYAWYSKYNAESHATPVARKKPNEFGLFDTLGNLMEWCVRATAGMHRPPAQGLIGGAFQSPARAVSDDAVRDHDVASPIPQSGFRVARTIARQP